MLAPCIWSSSVWFNIVHTCHCRATVDREFEKNGRNIEKRDEKLPNKGEKERKEEKKGEKRKKERVFLLTLVSNQRLSSAGDVERPALRGPCAAAVGAEHKSIEKPEISNLDDRYGIVRSQFLLVKSSYNIILTSRRKWQNLSVAICWKLTYFGNF